MPLSRFIRSIARWFRETLGEPTAAQRSGWAAIRERRHTLIAAPTGSGKTLAAFLTALDDLVQEGLQRAASGRSPRRLRVAAQGAERRHPQEPGRAAPRHPSARRSSWARGAADHRGGPHRRHDRSRSARRCCGRRRTSWSRRRSRSTCCSRRSAAATCCGRAHGHRRRNPRGDRHAARRAPRVDARAAAASGRRGRCCGSDCRRRRSRSTKSPAFSSAPRDVRRRRQRRLRDRRRGPPARRWISALEMPRVAARSGDVARSVGGVLRAAHRR